MSDKPEEKQRSPNFKRNTELEKLLSTLNETLQCAEEQLLAGPSPDTDYPVIFVMGPLRSGTTLFTQWLASCGIAACPTNLLSRFYGAPVVGAHIQLLLTDPRFNFRNEILDFNSPISFESENGKTKGALAPNEFWYFWRRFLPFRELDWLPDEKLLQVVDKDKLVSELRALTRVFSKPFALKAMILNYNIPFLDALFEKAIFVQIKRDPVTNVASILDARKRQLGSEDEWYSFKIPEYPVLKDLDPVKQAAGQLYYNNRAVTAGMDTLPEDRKLVIQYEDFCSSPEDSYKLLMKKKGLSSKGHKYNGPSHFTISRGHNVLQRAIIEKALGGFASSENA